MFGRTETSAIIGIDGAPVLVEADYGDGLPSFDIVGFLGQEVREAKERVRSALKNTGIRDRSLKVFWGRETSASV